MNADNILAYCDQIDALTQLIRAEVSPTPPEPPDEGVVVDQGGDLQAALDHGGAVTLAEGACFEHNGAYQVRVSGTTLRGRGGNLVETTHDHAFDVLIDVDQLAFEGFSFAGAANEAFQIGVNGTAQSEVAQAPAGVRFLEVRSVGHRGKRAFDVNAAGVEFLNCEVRDCYSPDGVDSQAICVLNAPGPVLIDGGYFEAASENVMVGGDTMKIPDCHPTGITVRNLTLTKPLAWQTAGTPKVKNLLELKDGAEVLIDNCDLSNSWKSAQDGYAFVFTPSQGGMNRNVEVRNCRVSNVGGIVNIIGTDKSALNPQRTQVKFRGGTYRTNYAALGGRGIFALIGNGPWPTGPAGPEWFDVEGCEISVDGTAFIDVYDKPAGSIDLLRIVGCTWNYPKYGIRLGGYSHGEDYYGIVKQIVIEGCTITGAASGFKSRYPNNIYLSTYRYGRDAERVRDKVLPEDRDEYERYEQCPYRDE
jgi:hypothetical protein